MPILKANGIHIYYETHGAGDPLLLIMGLGANSTAWFLQVPEFSKHYQVIAFDNRGAGRSDKPNEPYTIMQMADDAAGLMEELGMASAHVFGMSLGGMIAQELTLRHPARVRTLVLGGTMAGGPQAIRAGPDFVQQIMSSMGQPLEQQIENGMRFLYSEAFFSANRARLLERSLELAHLMPPPHALQRQFMAVMTFNTHERLGHIRVPTLVLTGTADRIVPAGNSRILAEGIAGAELIEFPGAGHGFLVECSAETNRAVLGFLGRHATHYVGPK